MLGRLLLLVLAAAYLLLLPLAAAWLFRAARIGWATSRLRSALALTGAVVASTAWLVTIVGVFVDTI